MFALVKAGQVTKEIAGGPYTNDDGVQYPSNIFSVWSKDELKELGIYHIQHDNSVVVDEKVEKLTGGFSYTINEDHVLKTYEKTDLDINIVKTETIDSIKLTQNNILSDYDWCYIRKIDKGIEVPVNVQNYRDAVRTAGDKMIKRLHRIDKAVIRSRTSKGVMRQTVYLWQLNDEKVRTMSTFHYRGKEEKK